MKFCTISFLLILGQLAFCQHGFQVMPTYRKALTKSVIQDVKSLTDINEGFPLSWIGSYDKVDLITITDGDTIVTSGKSHVLNLDQLSHLKNVEIGTHIYFKVGYYPRVTTENSDPRYIKFDYGIAPETMAAYSGGFDALDTYLIAHGIDKKARLLNDNQQQCNIRFRIDKEGNAHIVEIETSSGDTDLDDYIKVIITGMDKWIPAHNADQQSVEQEFILQVGVADC